mgnify:CR=1 FL=1
MSMKRAVGKKCGLTRYHPSEARASQWRRRSRAVYISIYTALRRSAMTPESREVLIPPVNSEGGNTNKYFEESKINFD